MRSLVIALVLVLAAGPLRAGAIEFTRVWPAGRAAESFDRISEYFDGRENTSGHTLLRTHADARAGCTQADDQANADSNKTDEFHF